MQSITHKDRYTECRLCGTTISSSHPTCKNCGLQASSGGIEEIAETEAQISQAIGEAENLKLIAKISFFFSIINIYYYFAVDPQSVWFNLPLWVSYVYFIVSFVRWKRKHSEIFFNNEELAKLEKEKRQALILIVFSVIIGFGMTIFM